ncbi:MAG TPA: DUF4832 domain-containing protein [Polyangiaceae bacterium]|nr:DUF4832 domain-containing protein [Polyangiaceae bacterium]
MKSRLLLLGVLASATACDDYHHTGAGGGGSASADGAGWAGMLVSGAGDGASAGGGSTAVAGSASGGSIDASGGLPSSVTCDTAGAEEPPLDEQQLTPSDEDFLNPERGFHADMPLPRAALDDYRQQGSSLLRSYVILGEYRGQALPQSFLDQLSYSLDLVRDRGLKVVLRFAYNDDGTEDAPLDTVMQHIGQLKPIMQAKSDVLAVLQAGFMGRWGEWHHSANGLNTAAKRLQIVSGLLDMLPASRMIQLRYPWHRKQMFSDLLTPDSAFSGMGGARVGHHNDCFLTSNNDLGTYGDFTDEGSGSAPDSQVIRWMDYVAQESRFTATGAETCQNTERSSCAHALNELARFHYSYLNSAYLEEVNQRWVDEGCMPEIRRRLGYRFELSQLRFNERVAPGGVLRLAFVLKNNGFAAPFNERPLYLVLDGPTRVTAKLSFDVRRFLPEMGPVALTSLVRVPATLAAGEYRVALWLPDPAEALQQRPEYAIRLANSGVWNDAAGDNTLGHVTIDSSAPGCVDHSATELLELTK